MKGFESMLDIENLKELMEKTKDLKVLYVEDNKETQEQSLKMFENFFDYVDFASNGLDGLNMYKEKGSNYYDIVICDMNMPIMNGFDMSVDILKQNIIQEIIMITAYNDKDHSEQFAEAGLTNYIHKPIRLDTLINSIAKIVYKL